MRPEAEQRLRAGFQRRVDQQREQYAPQLAHAGQLAAGSGCGQVAGVFSMQAPFRARDLVPGLLPLAAVPFLIIGAAAGVPGMLPAFGIFLFGFIAWYGVILWRGIKRQTWLFAFTGGFMLLDDPLGTGVAVRWDQVTGTGPVWTQVYSPGSEDDPKTVLSAYRLRTADGSTHEISRDFKNVEDPYREMGQLFRSLAPNTIGTTMPTFPTVDQIISAYVRR